MGRNGRRRIEEELNWSASASKLSPLSTIPSENENEHISNNPKVSVIIPTYNRANPLPRAVNSVLSQTFTNYEIINPLTTSPLTIPKPR